MLAVGVDLDGDVVAVAHRVSVTRAHGTADTEVERQSAHQGPGHPRPLGGPVDRPVVNDQDVETGVGLANFGQGRHHGVLLVPRGNDDQDPGS